MSPLCGNIASTASRDIKELVEKGCIKKVGA